MVMYRRKMDGVQPRIARMLDVDLGPQPVGVDMAKSKIAHRGMNNPKTISLLLGGGNLGQQFKPPRPL